MSYSRLITITLTAILAIFTTACGRAAGVASETWSLVELITKGERTNSATVTVEVRNCGVVERKTYDCSAGRSSDLSISLGGNIQAVNASINSGLGIGRSSGQSLSFDSPPEGFIYRYTVLEDYQLATGDVKARSSSGVEQVANYSFRAGCSLKIESQETLTCSGTASPPQSAKQSPRASDTPLLTRRPTETPFARPSDTPVPTRRPTETPIPSPTPAPDTRPGTILEVGQTWRQGGLELRLADARPVSILGGQILGIEVGFRLTSGKTQDIALRYSLGESVSATTSQGRRLEIGQQDYSSGYVDGTHPYVTYIRPVTTILHSGDTVKLFAEGVGGYQNPWVMIKADTADSSLTEIIVAFTGLSSIDTARWRIPIYH
jgi:hypothetical protein